MKGIGICCFVLFFTPRPFRRSAWFRVRIGAGTDDRCCTWRPAAVPDSETRDQTANLPGKFPNCDREIGWCPCASNWTRPEVRRLSWAVATWHADPRTRVHTRWSVRRDGLRSYKTFMSGHILMKLSQLAEIKKTKTKIKDMKASGKWLLTCVRVREPRCRPMTSQCPRWRCTTDRTGTCQLLQPDLRKEKEEKDTRPSTSTVVAFNLPSKNAFAFLPFGKRPEY